MVKHFQLNQRQFPTWMLAVCQRLEHLTPNLSPSLARPRSFSPSDPHTASYLECIPNSQSLLDASKRFHPETLSTPVPPITHGFQAHPSTHTFQQAAPPNSLALFSHPLVLTIHTLMCICLTLHTVTLFTFRDT